MTPYKARQAATILAEERLHVVAEYAKHLSQADLVEVLAVKGKAETAMGAAGAQVPFCGPDWQALEKAMTRLGYDPPTWAGLNLPRPGISPLPENGSQPGQTTDRSSERLAALVEAIDPIAVIALDRESWVALKEAYRDWDAPALDAWCYGGVAQVAGRCFLSVEGFLDSLATEAGKQRSWAQLKQLKQARRG
ncbi:MAG: hypothetical protein FWF30_00140 [Coriobacteriia bacterium]|nr:hypothetical protein [Coriobacteriia bacterium]